MSNKIRIGVPKKPKVGDIYVVDEDGGKNYYKISIIINKSKGIFSSIQCNKDGSILYKIEME